MEDFYNPNSRFDEFNVIHETAIIYDNVQLGKNNVIGAYAVIGGNGEIRGVSQSEFKGKVVIGDNNVISELVTIQRPFENTSTVIGSNNIIMAHSHIGHDVTIGDNCEICTGSIIGGYAVIADNVKVKLGVTVRNRKKINKGALVGLGAVVVKDVEAETIVVGNPAKVLKK
jgi:acyl-[acyl carrier protein]--UDP-N-acetylglucosamine O-acyltransferase